jgi:hypothetical protein
MEGGIPTNLDIPPPMSKTYFFSGAGAGAAGLASAGFSGAGAAFSGAGAGAGAGFASSFAAGGFSCEGPQPTNAKLAKNVIAIKSTNSFFIICHLLS